jgi:hypothetical protein
MISGTWVAASVCAATGYVSHLALDAVTCKRSLPLLKKGF